LVDPKKPEEKVAATPVAPFASITWIRFMGRRRSRVALSAFVPQQRNRLAPRTLSKIGRFDGKVKRDGQRDFLKSNEPRLAKAVRLVVFLSVTTGLIYGE